MNQTEAILRRLQEGETLTALDALEDIGSFRLAARVRELRVMGYQIETVPIETRTGKRVAGYRIKRTIDQNGQVCFA